MQVMQHNCEKIANNLCRVCLTDRELGLLAKHGSAIAHCPLSNFYFADVLLRVKHCLQLGVKVPNPSNKKGIPWACVLTQIGR